MTQSRVSVACLAILLTAFSACVSAQNPAADQRRSEVANEPMQMGDATQRDAAAVQDARTGWYAEALKTREERLAWWREAKFGCFIHWALTPCWEGSGRIIRIPDTPSTSCASIAFRWQPIATR